MASSDSLPAKYLLHPFKHFVERGAGRKQISLVQMRGRTRTRLKARRLNANSYDEHNLCCY